MDELQKLYEVLTREGLYTKSFQEFQQKWNDEAYRSKVFDAVSRDGLYTKDKNSFLQKYSAPIVSAAPIEKKNLLDTTESPSEDTSLDLQSQAKPPVETLGFEKEMPTSQDLPMGQGKPFAVDWKKIEKSIDEAKQSRGYALSSNQLTKSLDKVINKKTISGTEENASALMNYHFGDLGFKFEETGATGDWIIATAPNGIKSEFSIDNFTPEKDESEARRLKNFILNNSSKELIKKSEKVSKIYSEDEAKQLLKNISEETQSIIKERDNIVAENKNIDMLISYLDSVPEDKRDDNWVEKYESAKKQKDDIIQSVSKLEEKRLNVAQRTAQIESSVGSYYTMKEKQGTPYGFIWDQITEAFGKAGAGVQNLKLEVAKKIPYFGDLMVAMNYGGDKDKNNEYKKDFIEIAKEKGIQVPKDVEDGTSSFADWKNSIAFGDVRRNEIDNQIKNKVLGEARKGVSETVIEGYKAVGDPNTSVEYSNLAKENFWVGAIAGLIDFAPAMIGTPINKAANMFAISNESMQQEFDNNPNFKDVSEADRFYYALPLNIANSVLLEFGLNRVMGNKSFVSNLIASSVSKAGSKATAYELKKIMEGEIKSALAKGTISLSKGVLSGAELGTAIYTTDQAIRTTINEVKGKKMLETPESAKEFLIGAAQSAASLAVGAGIMSIKPSINAAYKETGYKAMNDNTFLLFEIASKSEIAQSAIVSDLKNKLVAGEITMDEAKSVLNSYRNSVGLLKSLPEGLSLEQKKQAMDLLKEKRDIERLVEGKDPALFKKQIERIKEINESLSEISENAIQKQTTNESVLGGEQPEVELPKMGEGDTKLEITPEQEQAIAAEGAEEVKVEESADIEAKKTDIERRRQEEIKNLPEGTKSSLKPLLDKINEKYDAEIKALEAKQGGVETKTALQQATEARKAAKERLNSIRQGLGINNNARLEALVDYHRSLVKEAKEFIKEKVDDISEWAKSIGEDVNVALRKAWDEAKGTIKEIQTADELGYDFEDIFGEEISKLPGYEETMRSIQEYADFSTRNKEYWEKQVEQAKKSGNKEREKEAKAELAKYTEGNLEEAMKILEDSETYKNATDIEKEELVRDVESRFEIKQKKAPSPEKILGEKTETIVIKAKDAIKKQISDIAKGSREGAKAVKDAVKQIVEYVKTTKLNKSDLTKIMDVISKSKIETEDGLNKAIDKIFDIVDKSNSDLIEISKTKIDKEKIKAELKAAKEGKKSVVDKIKAIKDYFDSVKEYGNLTRKDLTKIMREIAKVKDEKTLDNAVNKINDIIDSAKTDILEISELKMIRDKMKAVKEAKKNLNEKRKLIAEAIDFIEKSGSVSAKLVGKMMKKLNKVNLEDDAKIEKVIEYAEKIFEDSEYANKLSKANELRSSISKLSGVKGKDPSLVNMAKEFRKIKPSMLEDIDTYNEIAEKIKESLKGSKINVKKGELEIAEIIKISDAKKYIDEQLNSQNEKLYEEKLAEMNELFDTDLTGATFEQLKQLVESGKPIDKEKETIIRDAIKKMFNMNSTIIKSIIETGKDPFTGEEIYFRKEDIDLIERFMDMNLDRLSLKEAVEAIDKLSNFLQNGSTANMETIVRVYQGKENAIKLVQEGVEAKTLRFYGIPSLGRLLTQYVSTLPNLIEKMFKGFVKASKFERLSGITEMKNQKTFVQRKINDLTNEYVNNFYDKNPNGKSFDETTNIVERAMLADLRRTVSGTPEEQQAEFNRNKTLIKQSIKELKLGNEKERKLAKIYEEVYNKLNVEEANNIEDVILNADDINLQANDWWVEKWADVYDQLADVSENVYNKILDRDLYYTPKKMSRLFNRGEAKTEAELDESLFHHNSGLVYKRKTGVLQEINRDINSLPENETTKKATRYVDLSFDKNNFNAMYDALMDIHTAGVVRQIESFFKSPNLEKIIPSAEDRAILYNDENTGRVQDFIRAARGKDIVLSDEASKALRRLNTISSIGTATALGGILQPIKQVAPVALNTLINTRGKLDINYFGDKNDFINRIGYGISVRGLESQAQISSINKLVDLASKSKGSKALEYIEKANRMWLEVFLKHPDIYIAKASWMAYYEKALKKQGEDPKTIDYKTHEVNKDAADYAQRMVDRQQNISDTDLQGKLLGSKDPKQRFVTSIVMPFASFRLNQFMRATSDLATLTSRSSSLEDKKIAASSLVGYGAEMALFKVLSTGISIGLGSLTNYIMDKEETDEQYEKRFDNLIRGQITGTVTDMLSPLPPLDYIYAKGADGILYGTEEMLDIQDEEKFRLMTNYKSDILKSLGTFGIAAQKGKNLYDAFSLAATGKFTDEYGRVKYISENDREALKLIGSISLISNFGLAPSEVNTISKNAVKFAKQTSSTLTESELNEKKAKKEQKTSDELDALNDELDVLNEMLKKERRQEKRNEIEDMISDIYDKIEYLGMSKKEKEENKIELDFNKELRKKEREEVKLLLEGYDSRADLKRYNPKLYERNFGKKSQYYKERKAEIQVKRDKQKMERRLKDIKYRYKKNK